MYVCIVAIVVLHFAVTVGMNETIEEILTRNAKLGNDFGNGFNNGLNGRSNGFNNGLNGSANSFSNGVNGTPATVVSNGTTESHFSVQVFDNLQREVRSSHVKH